MTNVVWKLYVDGAAKGNPGPAGIGIYIAKANHPYWQESWYIGEATNNQAEYCALLVGLYRLLTWHQPGESVAIYSDSQLLVKQITGAYKIKNTALKPLYQKATRLLNGVSSYTVTHVPREHNKEADRLANDALKQYNALPSYLHVLCSIEE